MSLFRALYQSTLILAVYAAICALCIYGHVPHVMAMTICITTGFVAAILLALICDDFVVAKQELEDEE